MGLIASEKKKENKQWKDSYNVWLILIKFQLALSNFRWIELGFFAPLEFSVCAHMYWNSSGKNEIKQRGYRQL